MQFVRRGSGESALGRGILTSRRGFSECSRLYYCTSARAMWFRRLARRRLRPRETRSRRRRGPSGHRSGCGGPPPVGDILIRQGSWCQRNAGPGGRRFRRVPALHCRWMGGVPHRRSYPVCGAPDGEGPCRFGPSASIRSSPREPAPRRPCPSSHAHHCPAQRPPVTARHCPWTQSRQGTGPPTRSRPRSRCRSRSASAALADRRP